jgi:hypothetical protein
MPVQGSLYFRGIPRTLKDRFRKLCTRHNIAMTEAVARFMREVVKKDSALWQDILHQAPVGRDPHEAAESKS